MARAKKAKAGKPRAKRAEGRRNTHPSNGSIPESQAAVPELPERVTAAEAMRRASEALGDIVIDNELSAAQLREIGELNDEVTRREAYKDAKAEELKTAKESVDAAKERLRERINAFTHPVPLPLLDQAEREADHEAMLDAAEQGGEIEDEPGAPSLEDASTGAGAPA